MLDPTCADTHGSGILAADDDVFYCVTSELREAIAARRKDGNRQAKLNLAKHAAERRTLRESQKQHHPPGTVPEEARHHEGLRFKETQIANDDNSNEMRGFAVSSGQVTGRASVILNATEFDKMDPGTLFYWREMHAS